MSLTDLVRVLSFSVLSFKLVIFESSYCLKKSVVLVESLRGGALSTIPNSGSNTLIILIYFKIQKKYILINKFFEVLYNAKQQKKCKRRGKKKFFGE